MHKTKTYLYICLCFLIHRVFAQEHFREILYIWLYKPQLCPEYDIRGFLFFWSADLEVSITLVLWTKSQIGFFWWLICWCYVSKHWLHAQHTSSEVCTDVSEIENLNLMVCCASLGQDWSMKRWPNFWYWTGSRWEYRDFWVWKCLSPWSSRIVIFASFLSLISKGLLVLRRNDVITMIWKYILNPEKPFFQLVRLPSTCAPFLTPSCALLRWRKASWTSVNSTAWWNWQLSSRLSLLRLPWKT